MTRTPSRRTVLYSSVATLGSLAGCATTSEFLGEPSTADSPTTTTGDATTGESSATERDASDALAYASTETTRTGIDLHGNPVLGDPGAPVDLYYWSDFQCPFCNRFEQNAKPRLVENEVTEGTVRLVVLQLPNIGADSTTAALLAKCVWQQVKDTRPDAYRRWHGTVFDNQEDPNSGWASREQLHSITESVDGVDASAVHSRLNTQREALKKFVEADVDRADAHGISVTPGFVLYGRESGEHQTLTGAQPYSRFRTEIDRFV